MALISINPATGDEIKTYPKHSPVEIGYILNQASQAQKNWCNTDLDFRISCLEQIAGTLRDRAKEYSKLIFTLKISFFILKLNFTWKI